MFYKILFRAMTLLKDKLPDVIMALGLLNCPRYFSPRIIFTQEKYPEGFLKLLCDKNQTFVKKSILNSNFFPDKIFRT